MRESFIGWNACGAPKAPCRRSRPTPRAVRIIAIGRIKPGPEAALYAHYAARLRPAPELVEILNIWSRFIYGTLLDDRERAIAEAELICFDNPRPGRPYEISIELPEFTCKCPFSGYPDFAVLRLLYQPGPRVVELKAIKLYVNSYRDRSISHEEVANRILDDLVAATDPQWMQLEADFHPRGNVHTVVRVSHGTRLPC
jgi:7-cyano-7-deazaguanine reductase